VIETIAAADASLVWRLAQEIATPANRGKSRQMPAGRTLATCGSFRREAALRMRHPGHGRHDTSRAPAAAARQACRDRPSRAALAELDRAYRRAYLADQNDIRAGVKRMLHQWEKDAAASARWWRQRTAAGRERKKSSTKSIAR
jgi:hypothetical protein